MTAALTGRRDVIVVGGGQAGLAIGYLLARQRRRCTILDAADTPAAAWRARWDSLRLFTPVRYDSLPGRNRRLRASPPPISLDPIVGRRPRPAATPEGA